MLSFDIAAGSLLNPATGQVFASRPYQYTLNAACAWAATVRAALAGPLAQHGLSLHLGQI